jgi:hypothetical protein
MKNANRTTRIGRNFAIFASHRVDLKSSNAFLLGHVGGMIWSRSAADDEARPTARVFRRHVTSVEVALLAKLDRSPPGL